MAQPQKNRKPDAGNILKFLLDVENKFPYPEFGIVRKMETAGTVAIARSKIKPLLDYPESVEDAGKALDLLDACMKDIDSGSQARFRLHWKQAIQSIAGIKAGDNIRKRQETGTRKEQE